MDTLRWCVTLGTGSFLCRTNSMRGNPLGGFLNGGDPYGVSNCQKLCNIHAVVYSSRACPSSSTLREIRTLDGLHYASHAHGQGRREREHTLERSLKEYASLLAAQVRCYPKQYRNWPALGESWDDEAASEYA